MPQYRGCSFRGKKKLYAEVVVPLPVRRSFHYSIPPSIQSKIAVGSRVFVSFGHQTLAGYVVNFIPETNLPETKEIISLIDSEPLLNTEMLELGRRVADYYFCSWGEVLEAALPSGVRRQRKRTSIQRKVTSTYPQYDNLPPTFPLSPNPEQAKILERVNSSIQNNQREIILLHGITASGKTEVYLQAIQVTLDLGRQVIVLVPEISLVPQTLERLCRRFGKRVAILHYQLSPGERLRQWKKIKAGEADVVVGARSAIFAPVSKLGLIIIDEEHEQAYKQEETPRYHVRQVAMERAALTGSLVLLGSATPSLESYQAAREGKYYLAGLTTRAEGASLPSVEIVDMRREREETRDRGLFSLCLQAAVIEKLEKGEQVILFLNQRGYARFVICRRCGYVVKCNFCSVSLVYHAAGKQLRCHQCNATKAAPQVCPQCGSQAIGYLGVGTQQVEKELAKFLPQARVARMDSDTARRRRAHLDILEAFRRHEIDILVGTQMVAKGLHFTRVTLVGVVSADTALNLPDFRSAERTFYLLAQVAGRAGRGKLPGRVIIQTFNPDHYSLVTVREHDYEAFFRQEIRFREELLYPPFTHLITITLRGVSENDVARVADALGAVLCENVKEDNFTVIGPAPAPLARIRGKYRWHLTLKGKSLSEMYTCLDDSFPRLRGLHLPLSKVDISVDVDPLSLL